MTTDSVLIRPAAAEDTRQLHDLMIQYIVDFYKRPRPDEGELVKLIDHLRENPSAGLQFVAEKDGTLVGFATLYFSFSTLQVKRTAVLNDLFVDASARGHKVGERLFRSCLSHIREHGFASMTWETAKDNTAAQSLYNKMGGHVSTDWFVYEME